MNIAITGGFGTGKSTVSKILALQLRGELIDTDNLCRLQMLPGAEGFARFKQVFGGEYIQRDGVLDRVSLRNAVFTDCDVKDKLENILHPIIRSEVIDRCRCSAVRHKILLIEIPLLFEVGWQNDFDHTVLVYVPEETCIKRVIARDALPMATITRILAAQMSIDDKRGYSDFVIDNSSTFASTVQQVAWLAKMIQV